MEEQVESIGATATATAAVVPKAPLKTEEISHGTPDNEASERSDGTASPPPNCSICLGKLINKSFTDSCLHQFCFSCLLQWSKIKTECPLCKQTFKSIIHNVRSEEDYDQYHVPRQFAPLPAPQMAATLDVNFDLVGLNLDVGGRRFSYRTTMTPNRRYGVFLNPDQVARREQVPALTSLVSREERRSRRTNPVDYRRNVYRFGIWATSLPDIFGNFRECSADYYRREPTQLNRLIPWLNRELQVLLNNNAPHVAYVMRIIMESLSRYDLRSPEFRDVVRPYFGIHAEHFVHELLNYARTGFDVIGYDQYVTYVPTHGLSNEYVPLVTSPSSSGSSTSNDSDVQVVDETIDTGRLNVEMPRVGPHTVEMPGPSTVAEAFHEQIPSSRMVLTISSSSSGASDNECEVVGYVKPRHERTPEIIDLLSSDAETANVTNPAPVDYGDHTRHSYQPVTRQYTAYEDSVGPSLLDSPSVPTSGEVYKPGTSTERKRGPVRNNNRITVKSRILDTTSSESEDFDSDRDYTPRGSSKSKTKLKRSAAASVRQQKHKQRTSTFGQMRRRMKVLISSSSESEDKSRRRVYEQTPASPESDKRRYSSSWSDSSPERRNKRPKTKGKSKSMQSEVSNPIKVRKDLIKREEWYGQDCAESDVSQMSASLSEHVSFPSKKCELKRYRPNKDSDSEKETRRDESEGNETSSKKPTDGKFKRECSTSDSERTLLNARSSSQCSVRSSKAHNGKKKSKHKDKRREKRSRRSNSKSVLNIATDSFQADDGTPSVSTTSVTSSVRSEMLLPSKYSNSKKRPSSKERRRSHKKHKESKKSRKRSKSESKSRSKKKKMRIKSSSSSDSERDAASKL